MSARTTALLMAPVWIGFVGGALTGHPLDGLLVALGGYIVLFGAGQTGRRRLRIQSFAAVSLLAAVAVGQSAAASVWWTLLGYVAVSLIMVLVTARWFDPGPPGPFFFVLMVGGGTLLAPLGSLVRILPFVALGSGLAVAFGQLDSRMHRFTGPPAAAVPTSTDIWPSLARVLPALTAAVGISAWRGDPHPFWVVLVVVLVLSYPGDAHTLTARAVARLLGTLVGILLFLPLTRIHFGSAGFTVWLCLMMWPMSRLTTRNYLLGSVVITMFALSLTVPLAPAETPATLALERTLDTLVAVALSTLALWLVPPRLPHHEGG